MCPALIFLSLSRCFCVLPALSSQAFLLLSRTVNRKSCHHFPSPLFPVACALLPRSSRGFALQQAVEDCNFPGINDLHTLCSLFCTREFDNPFSFISFRTLLQKPGSGYTPENQVFVFMHLRTFTPSDVCEGLTTPPARRVRFSQSTWNNSRAALKRRHSPRSIADRVAGSLFLCLG